MPTLESEAKGSPGADAPSAKEVSISGEGYNQTYIILKKDKTSQMPGGGAKAAGYGDSVHDVFFRCGNWCYRGPIQFNGMELGTEDLPIIIPNLQKQQGSLRYFCNAKAIPKSTVFYDQLDFVREATDFIGREISSSRVDEELMKMSGVYPWIEDEDSKTYFEMECDPPACMEQVALIASKTYARGLIIISIFCEQNLYVVVLPGEGTQPLLDVRFPDVSSHGEGVHLASYDTSREEYFRKLTLWHIVNESNGRSSSKDKRESHVPKIRTLSVSSKSYEQTYCIMKSSWDASSPMLSVHRDVLFRFGSWCYVGRVQLTPSLTLSDIPFVIPALRMQQSRLDYFCDVSNVPVTSPFAGALEYMKSLNPLIEDEIVESEDNLRGMMKRLTDLGLGESVTNWLEGDSSNSFFEFQLSPEAANDEALQNMELVASKAYHASGIITITILFQKSIYVCVQDGSNENPLLDSRFPDVSGRGRGYQIKGYPTGSDVWPDLRKVSIWQTVSALEQEFRERASKLIASPGVSTSASAPSGSEPDSPSRRSDPVYGGAKPDGHGSDFAAMTKEDAPEVTGPGPSSSGTGSSVTSLDLVADAKATIDYAQSGRTRTDSEVGRVLSAHAAAEDNSPRTSPERGERGFPASERVSASQSSRPRSPQVAEDKGVEMAPSSSGSPSSSATATGTPAKATSYEGGSKAQLTTPTFTINRPDPLSAEGLSSKMKVARPHHLPKMQLGDGLSSRMDEIRKHMSLDAPGKDGGAAAPWDEATGRPVLGKPNPLGSPGLGRGLLNRDNDPLLGAGAKK